MTDQQVALLTKAMKDNSKTGFDKPHQVTVIRESMTRRGVKADIIDAVIGDISPFLNASAALGDLKRDGLIEEALTDAAKAKVAALKKTLAAGS